MRYPLRWREIVEDCLLEGLSIAKTIKRLQASGVKKCTPSQVDSCRREIQNRWEGEEREGRQLRRAEMRARLLELYGRALQAGEYNSALGSLRLLARMDGLEQPVRIAVESTLYIQAMGPVERHDEIERLLARRKLYLEVKNS